MRVKLKFGHHLHIEGVTELSSSIQTRPWSEKVLWRVMMHITVNKKASDWDRRSASETEPGESG